MANLLNIPTIEEVTLGEIPETAYSEIEMLNADIPPAMVKFNVMQALIEFAERSRTQLRTVKVCTVCGVEGYKIELPQGERFVSFQSPEGLGHGTAPCGSYRYTWLASSEQVLFSPKPQRSECLEIVVATAPTITACSVDLNLLTRNYRTIMHGVKSYFYLMKGEHVDWSDGQLATFHDQKFQAGIVAASIDKITGHHAGPFKLNARRVV